MNSYHKKLVKEILGISEVELDNIAEVKFIYSKDKQDFVFTCGDITINKIIESRLDFDCLRRYFDEVFISH